MLPKQISDLATRTYLASNGDAVRNLGISARRWQEQFAFNSIRGGPAVAVLTNLGAESVKASYGSAAEALKNACEAHGYRPRLQDLERALDELVPKNSDGVKAVMEGHLGAHANPGAVSNSLDGALMMARGQGRALAMSDLAHFAARSHRDKRAERKRMVEKVLYLALGAFLAKLPDLLQFAWIHLKTLMH
jgi:hypothetical protein